MARGLSLHIGVDRVDPAHYAGWEGPLNSCEADASLMKSIAESDGFASTTLRTSEATRSAVLEAISNAAQSLKPGDTFLISYAGHGHRRGRAGQEG